MRITSLALFAGLGLSLVSACRSSGDDSSNPDGNNPGSNSDGSNGSGGFTKIQDIQNGTITTGTAVTLGGVVVTAIDTRSTNSSKGNIWVEEPEGGAFSGVLVHGGALTDVAALTVGDIVTVTGGVKDEFALSSDTSGNTDTEVDAPQGGAIVITKTGTGTLPTAVPVNALMIGQLATSAACKPPNAISCATNVAWRMYEGVLIDVSSGTGGLTAFGAPKGSGNEIEFNTNGQIDVENQLADFPTIKSGDCLGSVTGVLDYFFQYNLLPTSTANVVTGGASCPPREVSTGTAVGLCGDTTDNDGNGFSDCADLSCETGSGAWLDPTNCDHATNSTCGCSANLATAGVSSINTGATATFAPVILNNVTVTAVSNSGFWVADAAAGAVNGGIFVFTSSTPTVTIGQKLATLQGLAQAFNPSKIKSTATPPPVTILEFEDSTVGTATAGTAPTALVTTATVAGNLATGNTLAGSLVKLTDVKVKAAGSFNQLTLVDNTNATITMDDSAFFGYGGGSGSADIPAVGTCFTSLTGVMSLTTTDSAGSNEVRTINPRNATDMAVDATPADCKGN